MTKNENEQTSSKALISVGDKTDEAVGEFIHAVAGETGKGVVAFGGDIFGGLFGDRIREWRTKNFINSCAKSAEHFKSMGVDLTKLNALPNGELYALFDGMSKAENEKLSDMYAALLANALDPKQNGQANLGFVKLLDQLAPMDVVVLELVFFIDMKNGMALEARQQIENKWRTSKKAMSPDDQESFRKKLEEISEENRTEIMAKAQEFNLGDNKATGEVIENLFRLGCLKSIPETTSNPWGLRRNDGIEVEANDMHRRGVTVAPFEKVLNSLNYHEALIDGIIRSSNEAQGPLYKDTGHEVRLNVFLTNYAKRFLQACKFETQNCVTPTPNGQVV